MTNALAEQGWTGQATPLEGGLVRCESCGQPSPAADLAVATLARVEGASDPGDMAAVAAVACPRCSAGGVLVLQFGPEASAADVDVLQALPDPEVTDPGVG